MATLEKVGRVCIVGAVVLFSAGYVCSRIVTDGILFPFTAMYEKLSSIVSD